MNGVSGWIHDGSLLDEDRVVVVKLQIVIFFGNPWKNAIRRREHPFSFHDNSLEVRTLFEVIIGQLSDILETADLFL